MNRRVLEAELKIPLFHLTYPIWQHNGNPGVPLIMENRGSIHKNGAIRK
ncbi:MAG: hypothetical protein K0S39_6279 [Paenibacillus sp.]|jgi:hypothetical protein|nr:hypothetical protein [Paenibacillus sp.]